MAHGSPMKNQRIERPGVDKPGAALLDFLQQTRRASLLVRKNDAHFGGYFFSGLAPGGEEAHV